VIVIIGLSSACLQTNVLEKNLAPAAEVKRSSSTLAVHWE